MGGLFCRGLHCAGCGKGIPAIVVVTILLVLTAMGLDKIAHELVIAMYWLAGSIAFGTLCMAIAIGKIYNSSNMYTVTWDESPMMTELKRDAAVFPHVTRTGQSVPIWPDRPAYLDGGWRGGLPVQPYDDGGTFNPRGGGPSSSSPPSLTDGEVT